MLIRISYRSRNPNRLAVEAASLAGGFGRCFNLYPDLSKPALWFENRAICDQGRRFFGLGIRGKTGVIGIGRGGVLAGRLAACLAKASEMKLFAAGLLSLLWEDCL